MRANIEIIDLRERGTVRIRQILQYRATTTLRRPQIKQYTISNEGGAATPTGTSYY